MGAPWKGRRLGQPLARVATVRGRCEEGLVSSPAVVTRHLGARSS